MFYFVGLSSCVITVTVFLSLFVVQNTYIPTGNWQAGGYLPMLVHDFTIQ